MINLNIPQKLTLKIHEDNRGYFYESYNLGYNLDFKQSNISFSNAGVIRGLHFQKKPHQQYKLITVLNGQILDVCVCINPSRDIFGLVYYYILNKNEQLFIPDDFAHGFSCIKDSLIEYKCSNSYNKDSEKTIIWNDKDLRIDWNNKNPIISEKDKLGISLKKYENSINGE